MKTNEKRQPFDRLFEQGADIRDKADWPRQMEWMYNTMIELYKIVKPHYSAIRGIK